MEIKSRQRALYVPDHEELRRKVEACKTLGKKVVLTQGVWDTWHTGHIRYIEKAWDEGDVLVVAVDSDHLTRHRKGPKRPRDPFQERLEAVCSHWAVDFACVKDSLDDPYQIVRIVRPDVLVISETTGPEIQKDIETLKEWASEIRNHPPQSSTTTTAKLRRLESATVEEVRDKINNVFEDWLVNLSDGGSDGLTQDRLEQLEEVKGGNGGQ